MIVPRSARRHPTARLRSQILVGLLVGLALAACTSPAEDAPAESTNSSAGRPGAPAPQATTVTTELTLSDAQRVLLVEIGQTVGASFVRFDFATLGRPDDRRGIPSFAPPGARPEPIGYRGVLGELELDDPAPVDPAAEDQGVADQSFGVDDHRYPPAAPEGTDPLTGAPAGDVDFTADVLGQGRHNAVVIKIDNSPAARPQVGLNRADIVYEEEVEGGITRFAAVFHSQHGPVGPIRSGRTTDISLVSSLGSPSLVYSGANDVFDALLLAQPMVHNFSATRTEGFVRSDRYSFPSNLFSEVDNFAQPALPPPPQFTYDADADRRGWTQASSIDLDWGSTSSGWSWEPNEGQWLRLQNGRPHETDDGRVSATNVVVVTVAEVDTGLRDSIGTPIPEYVFVGVGPATVFVDGRATEATWIRPTLRDPAALLASDGTVVTLDPGRTWVELVVAGASTWS